MNHKPLAIVLGEPYSTFQEIILKSLKNVQIIETDHIFELMNYKGYNIMEVDELMN